MPTIRNQIKLVIDLISNVQNHLRFTIIGKTNSVSTSVNKLFKSRHYIVFNIFTYEIIKYQTDDVMNETELLEIYNVYFIPIFKRFIHLCQCINIYIE